jgi:hypothetical protein
MRRGDHMHFAWLLVPCRSLLPPHPPLHHADLTTDYLSVLLSHPSLPPSPPTHPSHVPFIIHLLLNVGRVYRVYINNKMQTMRGDKEGTGRDRREGRTQDGGRPTKTTKYNMTSRIGTSPGHQATRRPWRPSYMIAVLEKFEHLHFWKKCSQVTATMCGV